MFKYPDVYYLDINLMYKVDKLNGTAKFDKSKKTLTVRVPVIGSTDESQKVLDQHYRAYKETHEQRQSGLKNLQKSKMDDEMELRRLKKKGVSGASTTAEDDEDEQQQNQENTADNKVPDFISQFEEAAQGVSKPRVLMTESPSDAINDKYEQETIVDKTTKTEEKRDTTTIKREEFLSIVKGSNGSTVTADDEDAHDIAKDGMKFKTGEFESGFKLNTSS